MVVEGVDYSYSHPSPTALAAAGKKFAVRYGGPGSDAKQLHADELRELRAHGIDIVANAEGAAHGYTNTTTGIAWAKAADAHFKALGMPADRPIYFSVDWDAGSADWKGIDAALRGSASVIGAKRVGVYGSYDTVAHCHAAGTAQWLWQTYAWSGGKRYAAHMYQYKNGVTIGGGDCDLTRGLTPDFGQWGYKPPAPPEDDFMSFITNRAQFQAEMDAWAQSDDGKAAIGEAVLTANAKSPVYSTRQVWQILNDLEGVRDFGVNDSTGKDPKFSKVTPATPLGQIAQLPAEMAALTKKVDSILAFIQAQQ